MGDEHYDTIIRGGTVIDGTGAAGRAADVAVRDGRIAAIGEVSGEAARVIDASGLAVAPGFIDVHSHDDVALINMPEMDFKAAQGVTTVVCGNCGAGAAPANERMQQFYRRGVEGILGPVNTFDWRSLPEFYDAVRAAKPSVNAAFLVPHGALRVNALGWENRPPTSDELEAMRSLLAEGMEAGAVGLSTGLVYAPGVYAETDELIELAKVVSKYDGIYVSHIRNEGAQLIQAVEEAIRIGEEGGCGVQISHHKASGKANFGKTKESLPVIDAARSRGLDVTIDAYPYVAASTALAAIAPRGRLVREMDPHDVMVASVEVPAPVRGQAADRDRLDDGPAGRGSDEQATARRRERRGGRDVHHGRTGHPARVRTRVVHGRIGRHPVADRQTPSAALRNVRASAGAVRSRGRALYYRGSCSTDDVAAGDEVSPRRSRRLARGRRRGHRGLRSADHR